MSVQDRLADGQAHPHSSAFRCHERLEHLADFLCWDTRAVVADGDQHAILPGVRNFHFDVPPLRLEPSDRIDRVHQEVYDDLLDLNRVRLDRG